MLTRQDDGVQRRMEQRHIQMIGLAGTIGTGLFLGSGLVLHRTGPAGALLAYATCGTMTYAMTACLGEMSTFAPISGGHIHFAERWLHPSMGFAIGWQIVFTTFVAVPTEVIACTILISFWDKSFTVARQAGYMTMFIVVCTLVNLLGVRWFGEFEFAFATMKLLLILGLIICGLVVSLGGGPNHDRIGFRYWKDPGAFVPMLYPGAKGKFLAWFTNVVTAGYSFVGMEAVAIAAAEVKNPRVAVPRAIKRIFVRILLFYVVAILVIGMLVPSTDPALLRNRGTAASSPFVIAFSRAGIKILPSIVNAGVLCSAFSATCSGIYSGSRILYSLGLRGMAPRFVAYTTSRGLPLVAVTITSVFLTLSFMALGAGAETALTWLLALTSLSAFLVWGTVGATYIRFRRGIDAQGIDRNAFHYKHPLQPFLAWWVLVWAWVLVLGHGWKVFTKGNWDTVDFLISYISVPVFLLLLAGYTIAKRPRTIPLLDLDFVSNIPTDAETGYEPPTVPKTWWGRVVGFLFT
ncbi:hypothetical protein VHUM_00855 [Vanrija humicola]|uniref:Amino acid permease/ SLC12A domain-containing protein n=1 Tax=Vanrija humicola TaxID=5417 RepID=A0A7D8Z260_VANHU|nr:hypothetical protein VHUM_00855 [Vanrija humicola]